MSSTSFHSEEFSRSHERRCCPRQRVRSLAYLDAGPDNGGIVLNLSENGLALQAVNPFIDQTRLTLRIQPPKSRKRIEVSAEISWLSESKREAGLHFLELAADARVELAEWISVEADTDKPRPLEDPAPSQTRQAPAAPITEQPLHLRNKWPLLLGTSTPEKALANQKEPGRLPTPLMGRKNPASQPPAAPPQKILDNAGNQPESPAAVLDARTSRGNGSTVSPPLSSEQNPGGVTNPTLELPPAPIAPSSQPVSAPATIVRIAKHDDIPSPAAPAMSSQESPPSHERRRFTRQRVRSLAYLDVDSDNGGMIFNLSENGLALQAVNPFIDQTRVTLRIQPPKSRKRIEVSAELSWLSESKREAGLHFLDLAEDARVELAEWISVEADTDKPRPLEDPAPSQTRQAPGAAITEQPPHLRDKWSIMLGAATPEKTLANQKEPGRLPTLPMGRKNPASQPPAAPPPKILDSAGNHPESPAAVIDSRISKGNDSTVSPSISSEQNPDGVTNPTIELPPPPFAPSSHPVSALATIDQIVKHDDIPSLIVPTIRAAARQYLPDRFRKWWTLAALCTCTALVFLFLGMAITRFLRNDRPGQLNVDEGARAASAVPPSPDAPSASSPSASLLDRPSGSKAQHREVRGNTRASGMERYAKPSAETPAAGPPDGETDAPVAKSAAPIDSQQPTPGNDTQNSSVSSSPVLSVEPSRARNIVLDVPAVNLPAPPSAEHRIDAYLRYRVEPLYPQEAREKHIEGTVTLHLRIGADGRVQSVRELDGPGPLIPAAVAAAREWRFIPALLNGQPVDSEQNASVEFRLPR
jgi:TonB family protein